LNFGKFLLLEIVLGKRIEGVWWLMLEETLEELYINFFHYRAFKGWFSRLRSFPCNSILLA